MFYKVPEIYFEEKQWLLISFNVLVSANSKANIKWQRYRNIPIPTKFTIQREKQNYNTVWYKLENLTLLDHSFLHHFPDYIHISFPT